MASNSLCEVERFSTSLRDCCPGWKIWLRRLCLIPCSRKAISAFQVRIMYVQSCSRACAGSTRTGAIKCSLNSGPGGAASQNLWNTGSLILFSTSMTGSCRRIFSRQGSTRRIGFAPWRATATLATACHLTRIIHIFEDNKSLLCYKHVVETMFAVTKEASECLTIAQHSVCCSQEFFASL